MAAIHVLNEDVLAFCDALGVKINTPSSVRTAGSTDIDQIDIPMKFFYSSKTLSIE